MIFRFRTLSVPSLLFAAACAACASPAGDPDDPGDLGPGAPATLTDQIATSMGVSVMSSDASGAPRLIRAGLRWTVH